MKSSTYVLLLLIICAFSSCRVFKDYRKDPFREENIESFKIVLDEEMYTSLSPGESLYFDYKFKLKNKKKWYSKSYKYAKYDFDSRFEFEVINGEVDRQQSRVTIDRDLKYDGVYDTVTVNVRYKGSERILSTKKLIVNFKGDCMIDFRGENGASGEPGVSGTDWQVENDSLIGDPILNPEHVEPTAGGNGKNGGNGSHIITYVRDTIINGDTLLDIRTISEYENQHCRVFASEGSIYLMVDGGHGGSGGKGGNGVVLENGNQLKGARGGNGGSGGQPGSITLCMTESAYKYYSQFRFSLAAGRGGESGEGGSGRIWPNYKVLGYIVHDIILSDSNSADDGTPGGRAPNPGELRLVIIK